MEAFRREEALVLPPDLDYAAVGGLSHECREKLMAARPATLGQAGRIEGVTPGALTALLVSRAQVAGGVMGDNEKRSPLGGEQPLTAAVGDKRNVRERSARAPVRRELLPEIAKRLSGTKTRMRLLLRAARTPARFRGLPAGYAGEGGDQGAYGPEDLARDLGVGPRLWRTSRRSGCGSRRRTGDEPGRAEARSPSSGAGTCWIPPS